MQRKHNSHCSGQLHQASAGIEDLGRQVDAVAACVQDAARAATKLNSAALGKFFKAADGLARTLDVIFTAE